MVDIDIYTEEENMQEHNMDVPFGTFLKTVYVKDGSPITFSELFSLVRDSSRRSTPKTSRSAVFAVTTSKRPTGPEDYTQWSGFQAFDLDIHNLDIVNAIKHDLGDRLSCFHWFAGLAASTSGAGIHIYTKIKIAAATMNPDAVQTMFIYNFRAKLASIYTCLKESVSEQCPDYELSEDIIESWIDLHQFSIKQALFITVDEDLVVNDSFSDDTIDIKEGNDFSDSVTGNLKSMFKVTDFLKKKADQQAEEPVKVKSAGVPDTVRAPFHYKHDARWKLANTLTALYGPGDGFRLLRAVCSSEVPSSALQGLVNTAAAYSKPINRWAVDQLNRVHGFNIELEDCAAKKAQAPAGPEQQLTEEEVQKRVAGAFNSVVSPVDDAELNGTIPLMLQSGQYLSTLLPAIQPHIDDTLVTMIESPAGSGKTEMVRQLAEAGHKVLLVEPYVSVLKNKFKDDGEWTVVYGKRKTDYKAKGSVAMTFDKFKDLNMYELFINNFEYIFIDESHLLFMSEYRNIMSDIINLSKSMSRMMRVVLMSGTPVGEQFFYANESQFRKFNVFKYIKVTWADRRDKKLHLHLFKDSSYIKFATALAVARDVQAGYKIMFPTNKGNQYFEEMCELIKGCSMYILKEKKAPKIEYYKKSNLGESFVEDINTKKSLGNTDVMFCTTYLSVGADIKDRNCFKVYISDETFMPQDIEQFANRLRDVNIEIEEYVANDEKTDRLFSYSPIDLKISDDVNMMYHSLLDILNNNALRDNGEYRYEQFQTNIMREYPFFRYNEITGQYYVSETGFNLLNFEERYRAFSSQFLPCTYVLKYKYGYNICSIQYEEKIDADTADIDSINENAKEVKKYLRMKNTNDIKDILSDADDMFCDTCAGVVNGDIAVFKSEVNDLVPRHGGVRAVNPEMVDKIAPLVRTYSTLYDMTTIKDIFEFSMDKDKTKFTFSVLERIKGLVTIMKNEKYGLNSVLMHRLMRYIKKRVSGCGEQEKVFINDVVTGMTDIYYNFYSDIRYMSQSAELNRKLYATCQTLFNILVVKTKVSKTTFEFALNELMWREKETGADDMVVRTGVPESETARQFAIEHVMFGGLKTD